MSYISSKLKKITEKNKKEIIDECAKVRKEAEACGKVMIGGNLKSEDIIGMTSKRFTYEELKQMVSMCEEKESDITINLVIF